MEEDEDDFYAPSETVQVANGGKENASSGRMREKANPESDNEDRMDESLEEGEEEDEDDDSSGSVRYVDGFLTSCLIRSSIRRSTSSPNERKVQHQKLHRKSGLIGRRAK